MTLIVVELVIILAGICLSILLFYKLPFLPEKKQREGVYPTVSVIIPARNEQHTLPLLLEDLKSQTLAPLEIICVDDMSEDETAKVARLHGAKLVSIRSKPEDWMGKSYACQTGAEQAAGELLLFLDADVRMQQEGLELLVQTYLADGCTISVQPFHRTQKAYEQFSMLFNLIQIAGNGAALPQQNCVGLYGPVILIEKRAYNKVGGHETFKKSIIEDLNLGIRLKQENLPFRTYIGNETVYFRMYPNGMRSLVQGFTKNIASGAAKTPALLFVLVFLWMSSLFSVPLQLIKFGVSMNLFAVGAYFILYVVWVFVLLYLTKRIGRFQLWAVLFFPVLLVVLLYVVLVSTFKKVFGLNVMWKGRAMGTGEKTCK